MQWSIILLLNAHFSDCQREDSTYNWVQGLDSAPDVPHAVDASSRKTEGNGVGVTKEPPVSSVRVPETGRSWVYGVEEVSRVACGGDGDSLCLKTRVIGQEVTWETRLVGTRLFIEIPSDSLPVVSKERYFSVIIIISSSSSSSSSSSTEND